MIPCFDGDYINDNAFRVSLVRNRKKDLDPNHAFLLLEGMVRKSFADELSSLFDKKVYRIVFIDFLGDASIRIFEADNLYNLPTRLIFSPDDFEKVSIHIMSKDAAKCVEIYNDAVKQQKIQQNSPSTAGYIHYAKDGGILSTCSDACDGHKRRNCLSWIMHDLLKKNQVEINQDFSLVQRALLPFVAFPPFILPDPNSVEKFKKNTYTLAVIGVCMFVATRIRLVPVQNDDLENIIKTLSYKK